MDSGSTTFGESREITSAVRAAALRPRDAASLIVVDRSMAEPKVLMGRRHDGLAFMPGKLVFPGGRTDASDSRLCATGLHPLELASLRMDGGISAARANAIAATALREAYEEAGILIGQRDTFSTGLAGWQGFARHGVRPSVADLRLLARAITPPGPPRRFDARFFVCFREAIALSLPQTGPDEELQRLEWLGIDEALGANVAGITACILDDLRERLRSDPDLRPGRPVPFYRHLRGRRERVMI